LLSSWFNIEIYIKEYVVCFLLLSCFLVAVFIVLDVLFFYFFFEATLIPMFLIVLIWGSRERKVRAAYYLFLYTFFASMFMLASILYLCYIFNTTNYLDLLLLCSSIDFDVAKIIWLGFFFSFATKLPLMPFHIWLPEAHVEAPTAGSVILAGVLLKLGSYGMIRFLLGFFPTVSLFFLPLICMLSICGIIYTSLTAIRQSDFKRIIAYSSVAHMSLVNIGIFSLHFLGVSGAILQSLSHGFVASALFLCIGVVYDRFHTRIIKYFSGLTLSMPLYAITFLFFSMANIALPGTSSFVGELLLLAGSIHANTFVVFFGATGMVLGGVYSLWLCNRILFGNLKSENNFYCQAFLDITRLEFYVFLPLLVATLFIGVYPLPILNIFKFSVAYLSIAF
jgi:NADH-quinone oxidoreductase subunit M